MPKFKIRITQVYRVEKSITVEVEAESREVVAARVDDGDYEAPCSSLPGWQDYWELMDEEAEVCHA